MTPIVLPEIGESAPLAEAAGREPDVSVVTATVESPALDPEDPDDLELAQEDPLEGIELDVLPEHADAPAETPEKAPLMDLETAVAQIPEGLRQEMSDLLRAEFREVIRWKPAKK